MVLICISLMINREINDKENVFSALAGVAQWIESQPENNQRVTGLIPSQVTCLGSGPGPQGWACEGQPHIDVSLSPSLPFSLKINK